VAGFLLECVAGFVGIRTHLSEFESSVYVSRLDGASTLGPRDTHPPTRFREAPQ
jgi:hypothetical protein